MIFSVKRDETGRLSVVFTYACLGRLPVREKFSFNILAREGTYTKEEIDAMVQSVVESPAGALMWTDSLTVNDVTAYEECNVPL